MERSRFCETSEKEFVFQRFRPDILFKDAQGRPLSLHENSWRRQIEAGKGSYLGMTVSVNVEFLFS